MDSKLFEKLLTKKNIIINKVFSKPVLSVFAVSVFFISALSFANVNQEAKMKDIKVTTKNVSEISVKESLKDWAFITRNYIYYGSETK